MIFAVDGRENTVTINNGQRVDEPPIIIHASTVCTGQYTDYEITVPKTAEIRRGKKKLANNGNPYTVRIYK
uniref:Uncharacterized protein n=1 Tax=viral metagenome TaxID=1070528 RepID=A0A6M3LU82_9ZZZZ